MSHGTAVGKMGARSHQYYISLWALSIQYILPFLYIKAIMAHKNSEYDQEIPQSQTAVELMAPRGRATQPS